MTSETEAEINMAFIDAVEASLGSLVPSDLYALARRGAETQWRPAHRHVTRGSVYQLIGTAEVQTSRPITEGHWLTIYKAEDGMLWARPVGEFSDGRFEAIHPPAGETEHE